MGEEEIVELLEEVYTSDEEDVNDDAEDNVIEEPDEDPTIPDYDQDSGEETDETPAEIELGDTVEPDEDDIIDDVEEEELEEPETTAQEEEVVPVMENVETLPAIGHINAGDRVMVALVGGEATVIGTVGSGDTQQGEIYDAAKTATNYITADATGLVIHNADDLTNYQKLTASGTTMVVGDVPVASFGSSGAQIGKSANSHIEMDYHSMRFVDKEGNDYLHVSDLRNEQGQATITEQYEGDGTTKDFYLRLSILSITSVTVDDATAAYSKVGDSTIRMATAPAKGSAISVTYTTESEYAKAYTMGTRTGNPGAMSFACGRGTTASGSYSHAEGSSTVASGSGSHAEGSMSKATNGFTHAEGILTNATGNASHAEGSSTVASGMNSHAEGYFAKATSPNTHAEGYFTEASGEDSHVGGNNSVAAGKQSFAHGLWAKAMSDNQTVIGKHNTLDTNGTYAFIIGNGESIVDFGNAFAVDWDGNMRSAGNLLYLDAGNWGTAHTYLQGVDESGYVRTRLGTHRKVGTTDVYNNLNLSINASGDRVVGFSQRAPWLDALGLTPTTINFPKSSSVDWYNGATSATAFVTKSGNVVQVYGNLNPASTVAAGSTLTLGTLAAGYRPIHNIAVLCQGSGTCVWMLRVNSNGSCIAERYRNENGNQAMGTSVWLTFNVTFITE